MIVFQTDNLRVDRLRASIAVLVLDVCQRQTNVLTSQVLAELGAALEKVAAESSLELLVIQSGKFDHFCGGWDLQELARLVGSRQTPAALAFAELGQKVFQQLAQLRMPSVAVIAGTCLGGGLELALACDYRVVLERPTTRLGMPQVEVGLLPAWGGTGRLPRLIGLERALPLLLTGKKLGPAEALACGLADALVQDNDNEPPPFLFHPQKQLQHHLPLRTWRQVFLESQRLGRRLIYRGTARLLEQRLPDDLPAPGVILQAIRVGLEEGWSAGLKDERQAFARLAETEACQNLLHLAWQQPRARLSATRAAQVPPLRRVGIVGTDDLANNLTQLVALAGAEAVVRQPDRTALGFALLQLVARFQLAQQEGRLSAADLTRKLNAIRVTTAWEGFGDLDLVLVPPLARPEDTGDFFQELEKHTSIETTLVTADPTVWLQALQQGMNFPKRCAGAHFFPPLSQGSLVEVVGGSATSEGTMATLRQWLTLLGQKPMAVKDGPAGLVYRVLLPYWNEAAQLVSENVPLAQIDEAMRRFGMPLGPLEYLDQLGLDSATRLAEALAVVLGERFVWHPLFAAMLAKNWLGQKTNLGFYRYSGCKRRSHHQVATLLGEPGPATAAALSQGELRQAVQGRLVPLLVNEAARSLEEKRVDSAEELDQAMVWAKAWPAHRGGPLRHAQGPGYAAVVRALEELAETCGARYAPCALLQQLSTG